MRPVRLAIAAALLAIAGCSEEAGVADSADLIFIGGYVYTGDPERTVAEALAVRGNEIVFVGDDEGARQLSGPTTRSVELGGRMVMAGLHDAHMHPLGIVAAGGCDLASEPLSLEKLVGRLEACLADGAAEASGWLVVGQWNFTSGNEPSVEFATMRAALDAVSTEIPIVLQGNDGHHGAANSAAMARAALPGQDAVGFTAETIDNEFVDYRAYIGVDDSGEPNGYVNETARDLMGLPGNQLWDLPPVAIMPAINEKLAVNGITSVRDAAAAVASLGHYDALYASGGQTHRLTLALFPAFEEYTDANGTIDLPRIVEDLTAVRERYAGNPLIAADHVKIFVDGVIEGDPLGQPPTLPNAALLADYLQPRFDYTPTSGSLVIDGYVDLDSEECGAARAEPDAYKSRDARAAFRERYGFDPAQCTRSNGVLGHDVPFIEDYIRSFDSAGFTVHAHAIGDRAVRVAVDAFEKVRLADGKTVLPHGIAHAQLVHPDDIARLGRLGLNIAFTFAWIIPDLPYDLTVVPFIDRLESVADLYDRENYTYRNSYPVASLKAAGTVITGGSDAPVDTREPRPFENIEQAVTRSNADGEVYNAAERIDIHEAIAAYTANGASALGQAGRTGRLEPGYLADLVVLDQNLVALADEERAGQIGATKVLLTVFDGRIVHADGPFSQDR